MDHRPEDRQAFIWRIPADGQWWPDQDDEDRQAEEDPDRSDR